MMEEFETSLAVLQVMHDKSCHVELREAVIYVLADFVH